MTPSKTTLKYNPDFEGPGEMDVARDPTPQELEDAALEQIHEMARQALDEAQIPRDYHGIVWLTEVHKDSTRTPAERKANFERILAEQDAEEEITRSRQLAEAAADAERSEPRVAEVTSATSLDGGNGLIEVNIEDLPPEIVAQVIEAATITQAERAADIVKALGTQPDPELEGTRADIYHDDPAY